MIHTQQILQKEHLCLKRSRFKTFFQHTPYLEIQELIQTFSIFDGYPHLERLKNHETLLENIQENILNNFDLLREMFHFSTDSSLQKDIEQTLHRLAVGSRKQYSIYKNLSQGRGREIYKILYDLNIISKEQTREKPLPKHLGPLKKELRGYKREDKILFRKEFFRFWYTFIYPYYADLEKNEYNLLLQDIEKNLDYFVSDFFEELSNALIVTLHQGKVQSYGGYWDKDVEIDLFVKLHSKEIIIGECKWKNHKVSKNTLNKLKKVTQKAGLRADYFALFSKNGFSKELEKGTDKEVLLYELRDFKALLS